MDGQVLAAIATATGTVVCATIAATVKGVQRNSSEHAQTMSKIDTLVEGVNAINQKIDTHIGWHQGQGDVIVPTEFKKPSRRKVS